MVPDDLVPDSIRRDRADAARKRQAVTAGEKRAAGMLPYGILGEENASGRQTGEKRERDGYENIVF